MIWSTLHRHSQSWFFPLWLQRIRVRSKRKRFHFLKQHPHIADRHLFLDVSVISRHDAGTGIQRIVRSVTTLLNSNQPTGWSVQPVFATRTQQYRPTSWPVRHTEQNKSYLNWSKGDYFVGIDLSLDAVFRHRKQLETMKQGGVSLWFMMYDLLPTQKPEWFSDKLVYRYRRWIQTISGLADGFFCISPTIAEDLKHYFTHDLRLEEDHTPRIVTLPMGWDLHRAPHFSEVSPEVRALLTAIRGQPTALMVGTLEPRKGHADVLAAFEHLWQSGKDYNLVIAGRPGWKTDTLQRKIRSIMARDSRLFWLENATDGDVQALYSACSGVIAASYGEGFGLPVIEALGHGKRVLARDIPVFHTIKDANIRYFPRKVSTKILSDAIETWVKDTPFQSEPRKTCNLSSWTDTVQAMVSALEEMHFASSATHFKDFAHFKRRNKAS